jgi:chorismate mutase
VSTPNDREHGAVTESFDPPEQPTEEQEIAAGQKISEALDELFGTDVKWAVTGEHLAPVHTHSDGHTCKFPLSFTLDNTRDDEISIDFFEAAAEHLRHARITDLLGELSESDKATLRELLGQASTSDEDTAAIDHERDEITAKIAAALKAEGIEFEVAPAPPGVRALGFRLSKIEDSNRAADVIKRISEDFGGGEVDAPQAALGQDRGNGGYL